MLAIILVSFLALIGVAFTLFLWQRTPPAVRVDHNLHSPRFRGLFEDRNASRTSLEDSQEPGNWGLRKALLERARSGELESLSEAHAAGGRELYREVLDALVESGSDRQEEFPALVSHISKSSELRATTRLAERVIETWKTAPDRRATAEMIHIAALSDDAATYERAVETVFEFWRLGKLPQFSAEELIELFVSQFWVIAPEARRGGVGFALKRKLLDVRRKLAPATPAQ